MKRYCLLRPGGMELLSAIPRIQQYDKVYFTDLFMNSVEPRLC